MSAKKILIIDDEVSLAEMVQARLESCGYKAVVLNTPEKAWDVVRREKPDLILLDIMMPKKDGYQVCDEIKSDDNMKHIPIIVFTAKAPEKQFIKDMHGFYGADDYLLKPFKAEDLLNKIQSFLKD